MWPDFALRILGRTALIMLMGPKKLLANWSRTRLLVRVDWASSSTVPISADGISQVDDCSGQEVTPSLVPQSRISTPPQA